MCWEKSFSVWPWTVVVFQGVESSDQSDAPVTVDEYLSVKRSLMESDCRIKQLIQANKDLKQEVTLLNNMVSMGVDA